MRIESPAIIISFRRIDCICSGSLGGSIDPDRLLLRFFCEHEGLLLFLSSLFVLQWLETVSGYNVIGSCIPLTTIGTSNFHTRIFHLISTDRPSGDGTFLHSFPVKLIFSASRRESFSCAKDAARFSRDKHFSSKSSTILSFLHIVIINCSHLSL